MEIIGVSHVAYPVRELATARRFYEHVLGLTAVRTYDDAGDAQVDYEFPTGLLRLTRAGSAVDGASESSTVAAALRVSNLASAMSELRSHGIAYTAPEESAGALRISLRDPDGNLLWLVEAQADLTGPAIVHQ